MEPSRWIEVVAKKTYQRGLGAGFIDNEETRKRLSFFAQKGMLRVMLLDGDEVPISFDIELYIRTFFMRPRLATFLMWQNTRLARLLL
jgi:hypothetical protein